MKIKLTLFLIVMSFGNAVSQKDTSRLFSRIIELRNIPIKIGSPKAEFEWRTVQNFDWSHEAPKSVYDKETNIYGDSYVNPKGYRIVLDARPSTLPKPQNVRYPKYHWLIEQVIIHGQGPIIEKTKIIENIFLTGLPILSLSKDPMGEITFKVKDESSSPDDEVKPEEVDFNPNVGYGSMLPSEGVYKITLEIIDDFSTDGPNNVLAKTTKYIRIKNFVIVIFGDSNASGEGNPEVDGKYGGTDGLFDVHDECEGGKFSTVLEALPDSVGTVLDLIPVVDTTIHKHREVVWLEPKGHRSSKSGHFLAAKRLMKNPHVFVTILSFANSGASYQKGMIGPQHPHQNFGQIDEAKINLGNRSVDFVFMSIGINDLNFVKFIVDLMIGGSITYFFTGDGKQVPKDMVEKLESLYSKVGGLCEKIRTTFPNPSLKIYVTEYPEGVFHNDTKKPDVSCGMFDGFFLGISEMEANIAEGVNEELNAKVRRGASFKERVVFIDGIANKFHGHGYCSSTPYFVQNNQSCHKQGDFKGTIHSNAIGHQQTANQIFEQLDKDIKELKFKNVKLDY